MNPNSESPGPSGGVLKSIIVGAGFLVVVVLMLMWLAGSFHRKVGGSSAQASPGLAGRPIGDAAVVSARLIRVPRVESAVGTIESAHDIAVASKLLAKVSAVNVKAGQHVTRDEVLVKLDDADLLARLEQAEAALRRARSERDQAKIEYDRIKKLFAQGAAAKIEFQRTETALRSTEADVERAEQQVAEARTIIGYATIKSPIDGVVIDKEVESGDTVVPGQVLLKLYDPRKMQLVARVRESLTRRLKVGQDVGVRIETLGRVCRGRVSEIVPEAETASRTFSVKVTGPCPPDVYTGMFGRLLIPLDEQEVLVVPKSAVRRVGQLELVDVVTDGRRLRRAVKTGRNYGEDVEILAGLHEGEGVVVGGGSAPAAGA